MKPKLDQAKSGLKCFNGKLNILVRLTILFHHSAAAYVFLVRLAVHHNRNGYRSVEWSYSAFQVLQKVNGEFLSGKNRFSCAFVPQTGRTPDFSVNRY